MPHRQPRTTIVVVDENRADYDAIAPLARETSTTIHFLSEGRQALRAAARERDALWLISTRLPDMSGFDLFEMIRDRLDSAAVCMVASEYRVADEIRAYRAGATMYACKPLETEWLRECVQQARLPDPLRPGSALHRPL